MIRMIMKTVQNNTMISYGKFKNYVQQNITHIKYYQILVTPSFETGPSLT